MAQLMHLAAIRALSVRHAVAEFVRDSKLRMLVVFGLLLLFWALMFGMFLDAFIFIRGYREISGMLLDYLFAFFFLSLMVMMTISNSIIAYASLYGSEETEFLSVLPAPSATVFTYRGSDSLVFSGWGMVTLVVPMILAYGLVFSTHIAFYLFAVVQAALFLILLTEAGAVVALLTASLLPRRKKPLLIALASTTIVLLAVWTIPIWRRTPDDVFTEGAIKQIMDRIAICQHWALPSRWVAQGMLTAGRGDAGQAGFYLLLLLSNTLFLGIVSHWGAGRLYRRSWGRVQGSSFRREYQASGWFDRLCRSLSGFLPGRLQELVVKDLKTFFRDPPQWSQFLLFFGLLGLYVLNLPRFGIEQLEVYWHSLISTLNLGATCLTLATLTTRFVFPQLSLEGRRIWITGLLPMPRSTILWGKFIFSSGGTFAASASLITLSDIVIGLPLWTILVHVVVVACVCAGLNGMAVGLGAVYPRRGTDNPSKIVSSFGGTLNLVCSICFIIFALVPVVVPMHLYMVDAWTTEAFIRWIPVALTFTVLLSLGACLLPMWAGIRAFSRMEF